VAALWAPARPGIALNKRARPAKEFRSSIGRPLGVPNYIVDKQVGQNVQNIGLGRTTQPVLETMKIFHFAKGSELVPRHFHNRPPLDQERQKCYALHQTATVSD